MKWLTLTEIGRRSRSKKGALEVSYDVWNQRYQATAKELRHAVLLNDPIQGECIARFKDCIDAQLFCRFQAKWQLERELKYLQEH